MVTAYLCNYDNPQYDRYWLDSEITILLGIVGESDQDIVDRAETNQSIGGVRYGSKKEKPLCKSLCLHCGRPAETRPCRR